MPNISVSDYMNERIETIKELEGHSSKDSAIRSMYHSYERVGDLEHRMSAELPFAGAHLKAHTELGLDHALPVPRAVRALALEHATPLFRLYANGPWTRNATLATDPTWLDVVALPDGILFNFHVTGTRATDANPLTPEGEYGFVISHDQYEDELLHVLRGAAIDEWLAPPEGVPFEVDISDVSDTRSVVPTFGGWGRAIEEEEAMALFDLVSVDDAIAAADADVPAGARTDDAEAVQRAFMEATGEESSTVTEEEFANLRSEEH